MSFLTPAVNDLFSLEMDNYAQDESDDESLPSPELYF